MEEAVPDTDNKCVLRIQDVRGVQAVLGSMKQGSNQVCTSTHDGEVFFRLKIQSPRICRLQICTISIDNEGMAVRWENRERNFQCKVFLKPDVGG